MKGASLSIVTSVYALVLLVLVVSIAQGSTIYGWGKNDYGQLGLGHYNDPVFDVTAIPFYSTLSITSISIGQNTHFASTGSSYYSCGSNLEGQLGQGPLFANFSTPTLINGLSGNYTIFALPKATIAYSPPQKTIFGCGFAAGYVRGLSNEIYYRLQPVLPEFGITGAIENVYTANGACFVRLSNGSIFTAGISTNGVFGLGTNSSSPGYQKMSFWDSQQVSFLKIFTTQGSSVCAQSGNLSLYCWGSNSVGQLGLDHLDNDIFTPTRVAFFDDRGFLISEVKQGITHTIALTCGGRVFTWGSNQRGQLGTGASDLDPHPAPLEVVSLRNRSIVEVVAGAYHNFARTENNDWFFWGTGDSGVSGLGPTSDILDPILLPQLKELGINHIRSSAYSLFALGSNDGGRPTTPPSCPVGWNVDECHPTQSADFPCGANMNCLDTERSYICTCKLGYEFEDNNTNACRDIDECLQNPCIPEATCNNTIGSFFCECPFGFAGDGLPSPPGNGCVLAVCGNAIVESGEECDTNLSPSCCTADCRLLPSGYICRNTTVPCDDTEYCNGTAFCPVDDWSIGRFCDYCGNGQCNNGTETCTNCLQDCGSCDACTGILCNGKCAKSPLECIVVCQPKKFACSSGLCVSDFTSCATNNCSSNQTECWDGSCATALSRCPLIPTCPMLTKRCFGRCIEADEECGVEVAENCTDEGQVCLNGQCAKECAQYNGCPTGLIRCPSGDCAVNISICKGACGGDLYVCADKSCSLPDNCTVLLRFEAAIPFTQHIPNNKNATVDVVSTSGIPIVALQLQTGTFKNVTSLDVSAVSFSSIKQVALPAAWGNHTSLEANIFSSTVAFNVAARTFVKNITVAFEGTMPPNVNLTDLCLGYINSSGLWDCASDVTFVNGTFIGNTSHFTPFAVIRKIKPPEFNTLSTGDLNVFLHISQNSVIIYVYCGLFIVFSALFIWAIHADLEEKKRNKKKSVHRTQEYEYEEEPRAPPPPSASRKSVTLFRPETPISPAGVLPARVYSPSPVTNAPLLGSSDSLSSSPSTSSPISSSPISTPLPPSALRNSTPAPLSPPSAHSTLSKASSSPFADGEMSVGSPETARTPRPRARTLVMKEAAQARFTTKHKWLSIYFTARIENLTRASRVTILLCMILTNMTVAAALYNKQNRSTPAQRIIVGVISSIIAFVCSFAIFTMFKLVNKRYRKVCYIVSAIWILGTGFLTLWYNLKLEQSAAYGWCVSASIGIVQDALVNEPVKIVIISLLIAFCPFIPFIQKL